MLSVCTLHSSRLSLTPTRGDPTDSSALLGHCDSYGPRKHMQIIKNKKVEYEGIQVKGEHKSLDLVQLQVFPFIPSITRAQLREEISSHCALAQQVPTDEYVASLSHFLF